MTVVATPTAVAAPTLLKNGQGGANLVDAAVDAANGNAISGIDENSLIVFRTTAAALITVTVYADVNGQEVPIDVVPVQSNAVAGGVRNYRPPRGGVWKDHSVSCPTFGGQLVFKASGAACNVSVWQQAQT